MFFVIKAERKERNENPDLIKGLSKSMLENFLSSFFIDTSSGCHGSHCRYRRSEWSYKKEGMDIHVEFDATVIAFAPGNNQSILEIDGVECIQSKGVVL